MTESEWFTSTDPFALLDHRFGMRSPDGATPETRQLRFYFLACCRRAWDRLPWLCRELVSIAELLPESHSLDQHLKNAARAAAEELTHHADPGEGLTEAEVLVSTPGRNRPHDVPQGGEGLRHVEWSGIAHLVYYAFHPKAPIFRRIPPELHSVELIREVFGNPFRETWFDPRWRTSSVRDIARGMYRAEDFSAMPILADALEDAGCTNGGVLDHCRMGETHVRGCWVLDGLLSAADRR